MNPSLLTRSEFFFKRRPAGQEKPVLRNQVFRGANGTEKSLALPAEIVPDRPAKTKGREFEVLRIVLALILLSAAALKGYQLLTGPVMNKGLFAHRWSLTILVEFEMVLGLWLISGMYKRVLWAVALACFSVFACVVFYLALTGHASCGCFGRIEVNPWYSLILDVSAVTALLVCRPHPISNLPGRHSYGKLVAWILAAVVLGVPAGILMSRYHPVRPAHAVASVLAEPVPGQPLRVMFFISSTCAKCREAEKTVAAVERHYGTQIRVERLDIKDRATMELMLGLEDQYGSTEPEPPKVFVGKQYLAGVPAIAQRLDQVVAAELARLAASSQPASMPSTSTRPAPASSTVSAAGF